MGIVTEIDTPLDATLQTFIPDPLFDEVLYRYTAASIAGDGLLSSWVADKGSNISRILPQTGIDAIKPSRVSDADGRPVVRFDGVDDRFGGASSLPGLDNFTVYYVMRPTVDSTLRVMVDHANSNIQFTAANRIRWSGTSGFVETVNPTGSGVKRVIAVSTTGGNGGGGTAKLYELGRTPSANSAMTYGSDGTLHKSLAVGVSGSFFYKGDIDEMLYYSRVQTDQEIQDQLAALAAWYDAV